MALEREFYRLSRRLHPDVYARASQQEQDWSLANSSLLNDAYRTLKNPVKRTEYLLKLEGIVSPDQGGTKREDRVPADLLEEVFELNMQLDEMRMTRQMGEDDAQLQKTCLRPKTTSIPSSRAPMPRWRSSGNNWDAGVEQATKRRSNRQKKRWPRCCDGADTFTTSSTA